MQTNKTTIRISKQIHEFLRSEARRISRERGYFKSVSSLITDLARQAMLSPPEDRPWTW